MIKWEDIAERADAIAEEAIGQLSGREKGGEEVAGKDEREGGRERNGEEVAREKALVERLQDSDLSRHFCGFFFSLSRSFSVIHPAQYLQCPKRFCRLLTVRL